MPNIMILNGSEVTSTERDKSERHFVRYFMDKGNKPDRFFELEAKHGKCICLNISNSTFTYSVTSITPADKTDGFIRITFIMILLKNFVKTKLEIFRIIIILTTKIQVYKH